MIAILFVSSLAMAQDCYEEECIMENAEDLRGPCYEEFSFWHIEYFGGIIPYPTYVTIDVAVPC